MSIQAAQLIGTVTIEGTDQAVEQLSEVGAQATDLGETLASMPAMNVDGAGEGLSTLQEQVEEATSSLQMLQEQEESTAEAGSGGLLSSISGLGDGMMGMVSNVAMGGMQLQMLGGMATQAASSLLGPAVSAETMRTAFTTLMGSTQGATAELDKLNAFAAKTPFKTMDIDQAASQLIGFGTNANDVIPDITAIGDALSAVGKGSTANLDSVVNIFGKIQLAGKLTGADMNQFSADGINAWGILEKQTGKTQDQLQSMISSGLLPAGTALKDLTTGIEASPLYSGGMAKQSATAAGELSTLSSNWNQMLVGFGTPIITALEGSLGKLGSVISSPSFQQFATILGVAIANALSIVITLIGGLISAGAAVTSFFANNQIALTALEAVLIGVGAGILVFAATAVPALVAGFITWAIAAGTAALATLAAAATFIIVGAIVALVVFGIIEAVQHWGEISTWLQGMWAAFSSWFEGALKAIGAFFSTIWNGIVSFFEMIWNNIVNGAKQGALLLLAVIIGPIGLLIAYIITNWTQIHQWLINTWNNIVSGASNAFNMIASAIQNGINNAVNFVMNGINNIRSFFTGLISSAVNWGSDMVQGFINGIENMIGSVEAAASNVANAVKSFLHFTKPDVGPLADVDTWMPDFGDMLSEGINNQVSKVSGASLKLATSLAVSSNPVNNPGLPANATAIPSSVSQAANTQITVQSAPVYLDGRMLSNGLMPHITNTIRYGVGTHRH